MALLRRVGSLRRNNHTYIVPRRPDTDNAERPKGMFRCHVTLLDDTVFTCDIDKYSYADALLNEVFTHLDILERDYFGLAYLEDLVTKWVDPSKQLKKLFRGTNVIQMNFRVKFYVTDPARLHEELTRYQFYLQVKKDLLTTRLLCSLDSQALLGAYIIQAELGDFSPRKHTAGYVSHYRLVARQTLELEEQVCQLHQTMIGKPTAKAEFEFLAYARRLEFYGVELFRARDQHGVELGMGITCSGICVYKGRTHITTFSWSQVLRITYKRKKFYIELKEDQTDQHGVVGFYMDTHEGCKQLWKYCIEYHAFFHRPVHADAGRENRTRSKSFRRKGRGKACVERTETQAMEATRAAAVERSKSMKVVRKPSGSFRKVMSKSPSSRETSPETAANLRRVQSLGKDSRRPILHLPNGYRRDSDREFEDDHDLNLYSPEVPVSDDMTGQFSLVPAGADTPVRYRRTSLASSVSLQDNGPTEFYDERNAMVARLSHVSSDELASEGLLLVRLTPDHHGKYGFIVKGGADERMPVIVTRVSPNSPASSCSPPLEEGDQVLYINGKTVADKPHEQIVTLIKTSSELVIILKPRNLQKVHPTIHALPSTMTSPLLATVSCPKLDDPGHMLRESLTALKGSLSSGKGQLHFDRLYRRKPGMAAVASKLPQNLVKNRYRDIAAYDETRVMLKEGPDYINANYVNMEVYGTGQITRYIASQGPMQHTTKDLWQMVWEERVSLLVMLTELIEAGKVRCCRYWPEVNCQQEYGKYGVTTLSEQSDRVFVTRQIRLKNKMTGEERRVVQMQYTDWPDHGIPGSKVDFLRFVQGVRSFREGMSAPVVVHCSAGIGRTGVFIMLETALCKMEVLEPIYPLDIVRHMRDQRGMLVQTPLQYQFVCESILKAYEDDYVEIELPTRLQTPSATAL